MLTYSFNDLLSVLMIIKIYIVIRSIVSLSMFATPRAIRMCLYNNIDHSFFFVFKCLQQEYPLRCTTVVFGLSLLIFGYGLRVTEGQLSHFNQIDKIMLFNLNANLCICIQIVSQLCIIR